MTNEEENIAPETKTLAIELAKQVYGNILEPGLKPISTAIGTVADLLNTILFPVQLLNKRVEIWKDGVVEGMKRKPNHSQEEIGNAINALPSIPSVIDSNLSDAWKNLVASSIANNHYHPALPKILSELSGYDLKLLTYLIMITKQGKSLAPPDIQTSLPSHLRNEDRTINFQDLSVSFAALERQKLIATTNNLSAYFNKTTPDRQTAEKTINPTGHEVTPLGLLLFEVCTGNDHEINDDTAREKHSKEGK